MSKTYNPKKKTNKRTFKSPLWWSVLAI